MDDDFPNNILIGIHHATGKPFLAGYGDTDDEVLTKLVESKTEHPNNKYKVFTIKTFDKRKNWKQI